mgnify:CR=1 FL=1
MTEWSTLRARFPDDEFNEVERIKEKYESLAKVAEGRSENASANYN